MKDKQCSDRKRQTRTKIQAGGLLQKSGLMSAFSIEPGDDLQNFENLPKANRLLGFLIESFGENFSDEQNLARWEALGKRRLK